MDALAVDARGATDRLFMHSAPVTPSIAVEYGCVSPLFAISAGS
jgi:hypothetical protein